MRLLPALAALIALAACGGGPDVSDTMCAPLDAAPVAAPSAVAVSRATGDMAPGDAAETRQVIRAALAARLNRPRALGGPGSDGVQVLAISTGGQNGAFSSGFLTGWAERGVRPDFDIVTGASAGALVAPVVAAGPDYDASLALNSGVGDRDVFRRRSLVEVLFSSALYDTAPLRRKLERLFDAGFLADLSRRLSEGRLLLIGATDLDRGTFRRFDVARLMASELSDGAKARCLTEAVLASSAIPALFPPRKINGALHADAGVRQHIFLDRLAEALRAMPGTRRADGSPATTLYLLVNSDLAIAPRPGLRSGLLPVTTRNFEIVTDEGLRQSLLRVIAEAERRTYRLRAAMIDRMPVCSDGAGADNAVFSPCVTRALFAQGRVLALSPDPWLTPAELKRRIERGRADS